MYNSLENWFVEEVVIDYNYSTVVIVVVAVVVVVLLLIFLYLVGAVTLVCFLSF
jgi:hypothetical protein